MKPPPSDDPPPLLSRRTDYALRGLAVLVNLVGVVVNIRSGSYWLAGLSGFAILWVLFAPALLVCLFKRRLLRHQNT
jgi:hypothetical protein